MKSLFAIPLVLASLPASAEVICFGCEHNTLAAGTVIGAFNPLTNDIATFTHTEESSAPFEDFWVFDLTNTGVGSISADFTSIAPITNFIGELWTDGGSTCDTDSCTNVTLGTLLSTGEITEARWEIITSSLDAGRYILRITGDPARVIAYSGQMGFSITEPATLILMSLGLLFVGALRRE
jgi:hypothetical protein